MYKNKKIEYASLPLPIDSIILKNQTKMKTSILPVKKNDIFNCITAFWLLLYRYMNYKKYKFFVIKNDQLVIFNSPHVEEKSTGNELKRIICNFIDNQNNYEIDGGEDVHIFISYNNEFRNYVSLYEMYIGIDINGNECSLLACNDLFDDKTIQRIKENFIGLYNQLINEDKKKLNEYNLVSKKELLEISIFNQKEKFEFKYYDIISKFKDIAEIYPFNIALKEDNKEFSYEFFDNISDYYGAILEKQSSMYIGVLANDVFSTIVSILSILKANKSIIAINPSYPNERIKIIMEEMNANCIIGSETLNFKVDKKIDFIEVKKKFTPIYKKIMNKVDINDCCYVIFTSGSTGIPKGVKISHKNIMIEIEWLIRYFGYDMNLKSLQILNYSFDFGLYDILCSLLCGGTLFSISKVSVKNFKNYVDLMRKEEINNINTTPSFFNILSSFGERIESLKIVHLGGEKVTYNMINKYKKIVSNECKIFNGYGPCECTVGCLIHQVKTMEYNSDNQKLCSVPIGKPTDESEIYILDYNKMIQPINACGEIYIAGDSVGIGYINESNNDKFVYLPEITSKKMYKTGDLARWLSNGEVEYIGREDLQVKINGFRIELSEIDSVIMKMREVVDVKTIYNKRLLSYVCTNKEITVEQIERYISKYLPFYMIPKTIYLVDRLPYLASGKIDERKLYDIEDENKL